MVLEHDFACTVKETNAFIRPLSQIEHCCGIRRLSNNYVHGSPAMLITIFFLCTSSAFEKMITSCILCASFIMFVGMATIWVWFLFVFSLYSKSLLCLCQVKANLRNVLILHWFFFFFESNSMRRICWGLKDNIFSDVNLPISGFCRLVFDFNLKQLLCDSG